ncbi:MAG TPA: hypothetical protein VF503_04885 [Sphingobium sp.]|uniref:hypothetical protein n=1 Tax=Sphingobium sp. TaxID=1912891 RepID=UPI002ED59A9C
MRYFLDVEFNGFGGPLVSLALVPEDKAEPPFYAAVDCPEPVQWVKDNVLPVLDIEPQPLTEVALAFAAYLSRDPAPVIVADWPEDIAHASQLLTDGAGHRLYPRSLKFELLPVEGFAADIFSHVPHNALQDALGLREWVQAWEADERD